MCIICKKKQDLLLKTGKWFHGREGKKHNPLKDIEVNLLSSNGIPLQKSSKILTPGIPASSIAKAQVEEKDLLRNSFKQNVSKHSTVSNITTNQNTSPTLNGIKLNDSDSDSGSGKSGSRNRKHVTFDRTDYVQGSVDELIQSGEIVNEGIPDFKVILWKKYPIVNDIIIHNVHWEKSVQIRTRNNSIFGHFSRSGNINFSVVTRIDSK